MPSWLECGLRWEWAVKVTELGNTACIIPGSCVKYGDERLVVLNRVARSAVEAQRGIDGAHVLTFRGRPITRMMTRGWELARVGMDQVRVHTLMHTFDRRQCAAGVSFGDRQDLLGHRSGRITTHYSAAELSRQLSGFVRTSRDGQNWSCSEAFCRGLPQTNDGRTRRPA